MKKFTWQLICLVAMGATQLQAYPTTRPSLVSPAAVLEAETIDIAPKCVACTVGLVSITQEGNRVGIASGSAVIISAEGLMLTAGHVIEKPGNKLTVRFADGRVLQGVAVGLDHQTDTGLAKITDPAPAGGWPFCEMAPDDSAKLGEWVLATGNPGSIVVDRDPPLRLGRVSGHDGGAIGTNCALEPGDSGGPVFDLSGRVVGINSRIMTSDGNTPPPEYLSLHVPISEFKRQWKDLLAGMNANPDVSLDSRYAKPKPIPGISARTRAALNQLAAENDPEALQALADEKKNKKLSIKPELMAKLLKMAAQQDRGLLKPTTQPTQNTGGSPSLASARLPSTNPTTAPVVASEVVPQKGVALALRAKVGAKLKQNLLQQYPDAIISNALLGRMMDRSTYDAATGKIDAVPDEQDLREMGVTAENSIGQSDGLPGDRLTVEAGKTSLQTLALFAPAMSAAGDCVVEIRDGSKPVLLGTVVGSDGWIVSKASDLPTNPRVVLPDGRIFRAKIVGKDATTDIALLKVNTTGLTAAKFTNSAPLGEWLGAPTSNPNQLAVGVVSLTARPIAETFSHFQGEQKIVLGVGFNGQSCVLSQVMHGMPAEIAGMKPGDEVFMLNGQPVADHDSFVAELKKAKAGDTLSIKVHRDGKDLELKPVIGEAKATTPTASSIGEADNVAGGKLSKRRTNFPLAIQTDAAIWADQCGGPLINLHGQAVGIIIARYDRVCTFALPAELVKSTVEKLKEDR